MPAIASIYANAVRSLEARTMLVSLLSWNSTISWEVQCAESCFFALQY